MDYSYSTLKKIVKDLKAKPVRTCLYIVSLIVIGMIASFGHGYFSKAGSNLAEGTPDDSWKNQSAKRALLAEQSERVARDLTGFVNDRDSNRPEPDYEKWDEYTSSLIKYLQETINIYYLDYYEKVSNIRNEMLKYGIKDQELERYYKYPTNPLGLEAVARGLFNLSNKIKADTSPSDTAK